MSNQQQFKKIVLNVPHASVSDVNPHEWSDRSRFVEEVMKWTDWHVDWIFDKEDERIDMCKLPMSRFVCDVGSSIESDIVCMEFRGLRRTVSADQKAKLMAIYNAYQGLLKSKITENTLLIDCRSLPGEVARDCDICIGYNDDNSKPAPEVLTCIADHFSYHGYAIGFNYPKNGSIAPAKDFDYPSVRISINKRCYFKNWSIPIVDMEGINRLKQTIDKLYYKLLLD